MRRTILSGVLLVATAVVAYVAQDRIAAASNAVEAPVFEVDPFWPRPLPNHWVLGAVVEACAVTWASSVAPDVLV